MRPALAAACGFAAVVLEVLVPLVGGRFEPGYSHVAQYISELGADGAAHPALVAWAGFAPTGLLVLAFLALGSASFPAGWKSRLGALAFAGVGACYLVSAIFPCDAGCPDQGSLSQRIHTSSAVLLYLGAPLGMALLAGAFRESPRWRGLRLPSLACATVAFAGFAAMLVPELALARGLSQRIAEAGIFGWIGLVSGVLLRSRAASS